MVVRAGKQVGRKKGVTRVPQTVTLETKTIGRLDEEAERLGIPKSQLINKYINERFLEVDAEKAAKPTILVMLNFKGGVAKTTTAASLAICLGEKGHRTLLIDFDGQGNISQCFSAYDPRAEDKCISDVLFSTTSSNPKQPLDDIIKQTEFENVFIAPSNFRFADADINFRNEKTGADSLLKFAIEDMEQKFDYIIIDCGPHLDMTATNAIVALEAGNINSMVIIPVKIDGFAIAGVAQTVNTINRIADGRRTDRPQWYILKTVAEVRTIAYKEGCEELATTIPHAGYFETIIHKGTSVPESSLARIPLVKYDENGVPTKDYWKLAEEIEEMNE